MKILAQLISQTMQNFPQKMNWCYPHSFVLQSMYAVARHENNLQLTDWVESKFDELVPEDGSIPNYKLDNYNLDDINPGKMIFSFYNKTKKEKYKKVLDTLYEQLKEQPRNRSDGFWHKKIYPWQMWLTGLYMYGPFYARYAAEFGTKKDFDDLILQINLMETHFKNQQSGLLYHAWDESRKQLWVDNDNGCSPVIFARAVGWYAMALVDTLDFIPDDKDHKIYRNTILKAISALVPSILKFQDQNNGLWFQVMDRPEHKGNYFESSASAMFVYFFFKIIRKRYYFDEDKSVLTAAQKGYKGICSKLSIDEKGVFHLNGICNKAGLGGNPYRDGSYQYYIQEPVVSDDYKGIGAFIYASLEHELATK